MGLWGSHFQNQYHWKWTMLQQKCFATIQLQIPDCAILTKDNIGFKLCEITISSYLFMLTPSLTWQICLPNHCLEKHSPTYGARYSVFSQDIVDSFSQQCHVWGGEFEIRIGHWPVMSDPSLDRHLLDMYIILSVQHFQVMAERRIVWSYKILITWIFTVRFVIKFQFFNWLRYVSVKVESVQRTQLWHILNNLSH